MSLAAQGFSYPYKLLVEKAQDALGDHPMISGCVPLNFGQLSAEGQSFTTKQPNTIT